jgi:hypothetical protein
MSESMTTEQWIEMLHHNEKKLAERIGKLEEPDPRATPDDFLREQFKNVMGEMAKRVGGLEDAMRTKMGADDVLDLADRLDARAEEYKAPYKNSPEFHSTPSASTWTSLRDVARLLRASLEDEGVELQSSLHPGSLEEIEVDVPLRWDDLEIVTETDLDRGGVEVSVAGPNGGIVRALVPHGMWEGIVELIARKEADELVERLSAMVDNN